MEKEKEKRIKIFAIIFVSAILIIGIIFAISNSRKKEIIETSTQVENIQEEKRKSIFCTDLNTVKNEFNNNSSYISERDNKNYSTIDNFDLITGGYSTYLTPTIRLSTNVNFSFFLFADFQVDYGYGGDSDKEIKAYEEMLIRSCIPKITDNEINDLRKQLGTHNSIKDALMSINSQSTVKVINYQDIKITRNFIADNKSNQIAYTLLIEKNNNSVDNEIISQNTNITTEYDISSIDEAQERANVELNSSQTTNNENYTNSNNSSKLVIDLVKEYLANTDLKSKDISSVKSDLNRIGPVNIHEGKWDTLEKSEEGKIKGYSANRTMVNNQDGADVRLDIGNFIQPVINVYVDPFSYLSEEEQERIVDNNETKDFKVEIKFNGEVIKSDIVTYKNFEYKKAKYENLKVKHPKGTLIVEVDGKAIPSSKRKTSEEVDIIYLYNELKWNTFDFYDIDKMKG